MIELEAIATFLNFAVVAWILWYFGRKPIRQYFASRSEAIAEQTAQARALGDEAARALETWASKQKGAQQEIQQQTQDTQQTLQRYREATLERARKEARRIEGETSVIVAGELARTRRLLQKQVAQESVRQAREYLSSHVDKKDNQSLVQEYLEKVGNGHVG